MPAHGLCDSLRFLPRVLSRRRLFAWWDPRSASGRSMVLFSADFTCAVALNTKPCGSLDPQEPFFNAHTLH